MKLEEIVAKYPRVRIATAADNEAILRLFRSVEMETPGLRIRYDRGPDFFAFLKRQAESATVAVFDNDDGSLGGVATFCLRRNYVRGEVQAAAYLSDLRLSPKLSKAARVQWRYFYRDVLHHAHETEEFGHCRYFYSAILDQNRDAVRAFTRNKSDIIYSELAKYRTVSLLARLPWAGLRELFRRRAPFRVVRATASDLPAIHRFLSRENHDRAFGENFNDERSDELSRRLSNWEGLAASSFFLAEDEAGEIVGAVAPWGKEDHSRRLIVDRLPRSLKALTKLMPLLGAPSLKSGEQLKVLYLTHFEVDSRRPKAQREAIFRQLLRAVYSAGLGKTHHAISFFDFPQRGWGDALFGYVYQTVPATLYQVNHRANPLDDLPLGLDPAKPPAFEIGIA